MDLETKASIIDYGRYLLILPGVLVWFVAVVVMISAADSPLLEFLFLPVTLIWGFFAFIDPGWSGDIQTGSGVIPWAFLGAIFFLAGWVLRGIRRGWARWRGSKAEPWTAARQLLFVVRAAAVLSVSAAALAWFRVEGGDFGTGLLIGMLTFVALFFSGVWVVAVEFAAGHLLRALGLEDPEGAAPGPVSGGVA